MEPPPLPNFGKESEPEQNPRPRKRKRKSRFDDKPPDADCGGSPGLGLGAAGRAQAIAAKLSCKLSFSHQGQPSVLLQRNTAWPTSDGTLHRAEYREKVTVPEFIVNDPEINFIGLMLGPRGQTQKQMEMETGAKITIRGRGSSKDGQGPEEDEDLYVQIVADTEPKVQAAKSLVNEIIYNKGKRDRLKQEQMKTVAENNAPGPGHGYPPAGGGRSHNHGYRDQDNSYSSKSLASFDTGRGDHPTETISIPADKVGIVIGRRGDTIKAIQEETGAFLQVEREHNPDHPNTREVKIQGNQQQIEKAKLEINKYIGGQVNMRGRMIEGNDHIMVPNNVVGLIIGKQGETIKFLQATTGCTIQVTPDSMSDPSQDRRINLSGSHDECSMAKEEIQKLVEQHKGNRYVPGNIGSEEEVMVVPSTCAGVLIGKGGDNVKSLAAKTGTRIQVQRQAVGDFREVTIRGDRQNIEYAKQEIQKIIDTHSVNQGYGWSNYGYNMWPGYDPAQAAGLDPTFDYSQYYQQYAAAQAAAASVGGETVPNGQPHPPPGIPGLPAGLPAGVQPQMTYQPQPPPPTKPPEPQGPPPKQQPPPPPSHNQPPPPPGQYPQQQSQHPQQQQQSQQQQYLPVQQSHLQQPPRSYGQP